MKLQYKGTSAVDIATHDNVQPGDVIKVADELGEALLRAGHTFPDTTYDDDGNPVEVESTPPDHPLWVKTSKKLTHPDGDDDGTDEPPDEAPGNPPPDPTPTRRGRTTTTPQEG